MCHSYLAAQLHKKSTHLCSIWAEIVRASSVSTALPMFASSAISSNRASRFSSVSVFESANALQNAGSLVW